MIDLLARVMGLGVASAMSPGIFAIALAILASGRFAKERVLAILAGGIATACILFIIGFVLGSNVLSIPQNFHTKYLDIFLGVLFLVFAAFELKSGGSDKKIKARASEAKANIGRWFAIGFLINITNMDAELFYLAGIREIFRSDAVLLAQAGLACISTFFFISPALIPFMVYLAMPTRFERILKPVGNAMQKYGNYIVCAIFAVFGAYLLWRGMTLV